MPSMLTRHHPAHSDTSALLAQAEQFASLLDGPHAEVMTVFVRGILSLAAVQLQYAVAGDIQAAENARHLLSDLHVDLLSKRYPQLVVPAELVDALLQLALAARALSGR